jgi:hypothetical protein
MPYLSRRNIAYLVIFTIVAIVSIMEIIDFMGKYDKTLENFDFEDNEYIISKNNKISYKEIPPLTPNKEVFVSFNLENKQNNSFIVRPSFELYFNNDKLKQKIFDNFLLHSKENLSKRYTFHVGADGQNEIKFTLLIQNTTNSKVITNISSFTNVMVSQEEQELTSYSIWVAAIALGVSAPVGFVTVYYSHRTQKSNELQLHFDSTIKAFEMLSGEENKKKWKRVYEEYWKLKEQKKPVVFDGDVETDAYALREKLNQIGVLYTAGALHKKLLLDTYGGVIYRLWIAMEEDILEDRIENPEASKFFEKMYKDAKRVWEEKHKENPSKYPKMPLPYKPKYDNKGNLITRV